MRILKKFTKIAVCAAIAAVSSSVFALSASADEINPVTENNIDAVIVSEASDDTDNSFNDIAVTDSYSDVGNSFDDVAVEDNFLNDESNSDTVVVTDSSSDVGNSFDDSASEDNLLNDESNSDAVVVTDDSLDPTAVNPTHEGTYWNGTSFIQITSTECFFFQVSYGSYNNICGTTDIFSVGTAGSAFSAKYYKGVDVDWYYYDNRGNVVHPGDEVVVTVVGTYNTNGTITINGVKYTK